MSIPDFLKNSAPGRSLPVKEDTAINTPITPTGGFPLPESLRSHSFASWLPDVFSNNPYFTAGFGLIGVGAALGILRQSLLSSMLAARRFCLTSLEIPSKDYSYSKVMQWLIARGTMTRHFGVETMRNTDPSGRAIVSFEFIPSTGRHFLNYKNRLLIVERKREKSMIDMTSGSPWETLTLTTFAWERHLFNQLLNEAQSMALQKEEGKTIIYQSFGHEWRPFGNPKRIRPFQSVILAEGVAERVLEDIMDFLSGSKWYFDRGIPYRRGYLLHGPPGCGKSSYVMAVAGQLKYNICVLNVGDPYLTDDRLIYLISTVPPASILLLEDIDGAVTADGHDAVIPPQKMKSAKHSTRQASFSGLLNALDGVAATEEKIIFMTTNFLNCLPEALIRPGRVDMKIRIGYATHHQIQQMFERFFPDQSAELAEEFASLIYTMNISMAELQGFFLFCKDDPSKAFEMAYQWKQADETSRLEETEKSKETVTPT